MAIAAGRPLRIGGISGGFELQTAAHTAVGALGPRRLKGTSNRGGGVQRGSHRRAYCTKAPGPSV